MAKMKDGCVKPVRGPIIPTPQTKSINQEEFIKQEAVRMLARVGKEAP